MQVEEQPVEQQPVGQQPVAGAVGQQPVAAAVPPGAAMPLTEAADSLLAARSADGDTRAFAVLVRRHGPFLRAYAIRMMGSTVESDDVVQDTFVTAWEQLDGLRDGAAVRAWLVRIATRKALDRIRRRREHGDLDDHDPAAPFDEQPGQLAEASERERALEAALSTLPTDQRRAWLLREMGDAGYTGIADELGVPVSTVRGLLARARRTLVIRMEGWR